MNGMCTKNETAKVAQKISWRFHLCNKQKASAPKTASIGDLRETAAWFGLSNFGTHSYVGIVSNKKILASKIKREAVAALVPFLDSAHPKTREVTAVALSFVGDEREAELVAKLLLEEQQGKYTQANADEVLEHFKAISAKLKMVTFK